MFARISYTWTVMGESWNILKQDRKLLLLPLLSGICCLLLLCSFALPMIASGHLAPPDGEAGASGQVGYYAILFLFYFANYFVITFFNSAIVFCAFARMEGRQPTVADGLREAGARLPQIIGWSLLAATVGLILRIIEDRSEKVGAIVAGVLGMAFSVVSYLVVPVLVVERKGPFAAIKQSTKLLRETWGDQIVGGASFGLIFFLLGLPAIAGIVLAIVFVAGQSLLSAGLIVAVAVVYLIVLSLVQSTLQTIFQTAVYLHARAPEIPHGFPVELLSGAMRQK